MNKINAIWYSITSILFKKKQFVAFCQIIRIWVAQPWPDTIHSLTPWSRALLDKPISSQIVKKFPGFYRTRRFISSIISALHLSLLYSFAICCTIPDMFQTVGFLIRGLFTYPFALYGFPYGIRQLFLVLHCFRKTSVKGKRQWTCAIQNATKKRSKRIPFIFNDESTESFICLRRHIYISHVLLLCISFYAYWLYFIYVWHVYVSPKTYKWFGTFIIKDGRYTFTFLMASMSVSAILAIRYYNNMRYSG
jgi:hypothetical protein